MIIYSKYFPNSDDEIQIVSSDGLPSILVNGIEIWKYKNGITNEKYKEIMKLVDEEEQ